MALADLLSSIPQLAGVSPDVQAVANYTPPPQQAAPAYHQPSKFRNFLGALGDALMVGAGGKPLYRQRMQASVLGQFLGGIDPELGGMIGAGLDPDTAVQLYKIKHGAVEQPAIAKEADYYRSIGRPELADELLQRHAEGGPLIANNGDGTFTIVPQAMIRGGQAAPASGAPAVGAVEDGYRFKGGDPSKQENWEPVQGGATASTPSRDFP